MFHSHVVLPVMKSSMILNEQPCRDRMAATITLVSRTTASGFMRRTRQHSDRQTPFQGSVSKTSLQLLVSRVHGNAEKSPLESFPFLQL
jgi:hypothetical protein